MPGYTPTFQLPYLLATESLHKLAQTTADLAARLETLISSGDLTGPPGPANTLSIGTVTTAPPGDPAGASIGGTAPNQTLSLTLPEGDKGDTGPANTLSIGTVTTAPAGDPAAASITGTAPNQTLSLTLPQGTGLAVPTESVPTSADLPPAAGNAGVSYLVMSDPPHVWVCNGDVWTDAGQLQGPPGEPAPDQVTGAGLTLAVSSTPPPAGTPSTTITVVS